MTLPALLRDPQFLLAAAAAHQFPADVGREVAFAGRSNAGKSSALNALVGRTGLARVSRTPGRTREVIFFGLSDYQRLADLPGYGYAAVSVATRERWNQLLPQYLERGCLAALVLVMDVRHPLRDTDLTLLELAGPRPVHALLTKADKLSRGAAAKTLGQVSAAMASYGPQHSAQLYSALKRTGVDQLRDRLLGWLDASL